MSTSNPAYASPTPFGVPITGDRLKALAPDAVRMLWKKGFDKFEVTSDIFAEMEGKSPLSIIQTETDTAAGAGQQITFTVASDFYGEPHVGDQVFETSAHFEELRIATNKLKVDWFRHGIRHTQRAEEYMGMRGEIAKLLSEIYDTGDGKGVNVKLGQWMGRLKTEALFMMFLNKTPGENNITISGGLAWNPIVTYTQMMKRWGATGAMVAKDPRGKPVRSYVVITCTDALTSLELDSDYRDILKTTKDEMAAKYLFSGGYTPVRGHVIKEYEAIEHDGYGAIGSPLNPLARLGSAITSSTTVPNNTTPLWITGGGSDFDVNSILVKCTKYFPNYAYIFNPDDIIDVSSPAAFYVAVVNSPTATVDPNKWGFYKCLTNDGVRLNVTNALCDGTGSGSGSLGGGSGSGTLGGVTTATTLGGVTFDSTKHSTTHAVDSLVVLVDSNGKALFKSLILSAACARRGYGMFRGERGTDEKEAGFIREVYAKTVFGQALRTNRRGRLPGAVVLTHNGVYAGLPLPT